jgi:hypothetical protein
VVSVRGKITPAQKIKKTLKNDWNFRSIANGVKKAPSIRRRNDK